jgi:hypothetical protein
VTTQTTTGAPWWKKAGRRLFQLFVGEGQIRGRSRIEIVSREVAAKNALVNRTRPGHQKLPVNLKKIRRDLRGLDRARQASRPAALDAQATYATGGVRY